MVSRRPAAPVFVLVDPSARLQPALEKAARLASARRARLVAYACEWPEAAAVLGRGDARLRARLRQAGARRLQAVVRATLGPGRRVELEYEFAHPRDAAILRAIRRHRPAVAVVDSHFHAEARRALFGPADWPLIRDCPVPLLYAKPGRWHAAPRIAAAVDPRHPADAAARLDARILTEAGQLARALRGSLSIVNAWLPIEPMVSGPDPFGLGLLSPAEAERLVGGEEHASRAALERLAARAGQPAAAVVLLRGTAVDALPGFAEVEGLDVLAMGAVARSRLYEALIGATAERLLERLPCDVLIVKGPRRRPRRR